MPNLVCLLVGIERYASFCDLQGLLCLLVGLDMQMLVADDATCDSFSRMLSARKKLYENSVGRIYMLEAQTRRKGKLCCIGLWH